MLTVGLEEEYFIVDPATRDLAPGGLPGAGSLDYGDPVAGFDREFQVPIVESRTGICSSLEEVRRDLLGLRSTLAQAATAQGLRVVSAGTAPLAGWRDTATTDKPRYGRISEHYQDVVRRRLTCGCHVHIGIPDRDLAVRVLNRVQAWLPLLLALSASSPFYSAADTGYESFRYTLWGAFPVAGAPPAFPSHREYDQHIQDLVRTGAILDAGDIYWDARLGTNYATLEFRIADALTTVDEAVLQAGLCRALVAACIRDITEGRPERPAPPSLVRAATWHAARFGLRSTLIDVSAVEQVPPEVLVARFFDYAGDVLEDLGDGEVLMSLAGRVLRSGNSAQRQRQIFDDSGDLGRVVEHVAAETSAEVFAELPAGP
jgi:carboxylate-amine ligase